jgi:hypothetical protein
MILNYQVPTVLQGLSSPSIIILSGHLILAVLRVYLSISRMAAFSAGSTTWEETLEVFSVKFRHETDLDVLSVDLVGVVREKMQPAHVSRWLRLDMIFKEPQQIYAV